MAWTANKGRYITDILKGVGAPNTKANRRALLAWAQAEGGSAGFNPFNTTQPGGTDYNDNNGHPVQSYGSYQQGLQATLTTLKNGNYPNILKALRSGVNSQAVASAIEASPWGTGGLVQKVLAGWGDAPVPGSSPAAKVAGKTPGMKAVAPHTTFDAGTFRKQAAAIMLQAGVSQAQGQPMTDVMGQLAAAKEASTIQVPGRAGTRAGAKGVNASGGLPGGSDAGSRLVALAKKQLGQPYVWGGESRQEGGFDCSGLVSWAAAAMGVSLPRTTSGLINAGKRIPLSQLRPGDLLVNDHHVVIYAGNGQVVAAPHTGTNVQMQPASYFTGGDYQARRVVGSRRKK